MFACIYGHLMNAEVFRGQKKTENSLELELQVGVSCNLDAGN